MTMKELAERVEAATGPDRDIDHAIANLTNYATVGEVLTYTASLDAAMTLVPEGWYIGDLTQCNEDDKSQACLTEIDAPHRDAGATAAIMPLALTAAALKALASNGAADA
jgi:hypothetical protein